MKYVAFFRGINVGGKNKVKMDDLKKLFYYCGFDNIKTYIQSGNVLFVSDKDKSELAGIISSAFATRFGFQSHVVLRSADEMSVIMSDFPFTNAEIQQAERISPDVEHVYIYFSNDIIDSTIVGNLCSAYSGKYKLHRGERELYLLCYLSIRDSKLASLLAKLDTPLTSRNQKTICKIYELLTES
ncbi:MAG: DUF1697 domain-containing protein [Sporomusa sp.]